jgi:hypothetical protein
MAYQQLDVARAGGIEMASEVLEGIATLGDPFAPVPSVSQALAADHSPADNAGDTRRAGDRRLRDAVAAVIAVIATATATASRACAAGWRP